MYFRVRTTEGNQYILRHDEREDEWTLQSGVDGDDVMSCWGGRASNYSDRSSVRSEGQTTFIGYL
jgi:hypothetical protein